MPLAVNHQLKCLLCETGICVSPHEAAVSPKGLLQKLQLLCREGPQVDLGLTAPNQVLRPRVLDLDLQVKLGGLGLQDPWDIVELLVVERIQSPLVDCLTKGLGIVLGEC